MVKPKPRAGGGRQRDSVRPSRCRRAAGTATLAHAPNYVPRRRAAPAAKIERHRTKELVTEPSAEETQARLLLLLCKTKDRTQAARFWCSPGWRRSKAPVRLAAARDKSEACVSYTPSQTQGGGMS